MKYKYFISYASQKGFGWKILDLPYKMNNEHSITEVQEELDRIVGMTTSIISFQYIEVDFDI